MIKDEGVHWVSDPYSMAKEHRHRIRNSRHARITRKKYRQLSVASFR